MGTLLMILSTIRNVYNYYYGDKYKNIEKNVDDRIRHFFGKQF